MKIEISLYKMATQVQKKDMEGMWWKVEKGNVSKPIVPLTQEQKDARNERFEKAYDEAVNVIFAGVDEKVKVAEAEGKDQLIVYTFQFAKEKTAMEDENGVRVVFGEKVRLMDILVKGYYKFVTKAGSLLNKEGDDFPKESLDLSYPSKDGSKKNDNKYRVGYFKKPDGVWNIFVSWSSLEKKVYQKDSGVKKTPFKKNVSKYNKKKNVDEFMIETKLVKRVIEVNKPNPNPNSWASKVIASLA